MAQYRSPRKKWATSITERRAGWKTHLSKAAAYRWTQMVAFDVSVAAPGQHLPTRIHVWVDEGLGQGWELYESLNLADLTPSTGGA